jgi:serine phosphatase RsbU (regulator of sigma subunit)
VIKLDATNRVLGEASIIAASGNPLGDRNIAVEIRRGSLQLNAGDLFVCFTDGVVERANPVGKLFGDRRLRATLTGQPLPDGNALLRLRDQLVYALDAYGEGAIAEDDITFVLCQFDPPATSRTSARRGNAA